MANIDSFVQHENDDVNDRLNEELQNLNTDNPSIDDFT